MAASATQTNGAAESSGGVVGAIRALSSTLVRRVQFGDRVTYGGKRDLYKALGYPDALTAENYRNRYERGGIAERIVEAYPRATWAGGAELVEDPDTDTETEFEEAAAELFERLDVWARLQRADILAGLGRYGVLLIGDGGKLDRPLTSLSGPDSVLYLSAYGEDRAQIHSEDLDPASPRFGLPEVYLVKLGSGITAQHTNSVTKPVHWSRVIHIADGLLDDDVLGKPKLRASWNYLDDITKIVGGGSEAAWKRMDPGTHVNIDPKAELTAEQIALLKEQLEEREHNLRRTLLTVGADINQLAMSVASFAQNKDAVLELISATTGIPHRILTGSERGELASSQDRNNWNDRILERRQEFATPLVRSLVDRLIEYGALPEPAEYEVVWPEEEELDEKEKAEVAGAFAKANKDQMESEGRVVLTSDEIRDRVLGMDPLKEQDALGVVMPEEEEEAAGSEEGDEGDEGDEEESGLAELRGVFVDRSPRTQDRRVVIRAAESGEGGIRGAFERARQATLDALDQDAFESAVPQGQARASEVVLEAIDAGEAVLFDALQESLHETLAAAGRAGAAKARARGSFNGQPAVDAQLRSAQELTMEFEAVNPRALGWAEIRAATLIVEVGEETREAVRAIVAQGIEDGIAPRVLARQVQEVVGLNSRQARAVLNLERALREAEPGQLVTRFPAQPTLRNIPAFRVRVPEGGLTEAQISQRVRQYSAMQHRLRARTIARTESLRAANEGTKELWRQAIDQGHLPSSAQRVWITAGDSAVRDDHVAMEGVVVGVDEPFSAPDGSSEPGDAPGCRCAQGIARSEDVDLFRSREVPS